MTSQRQVGIAALAVMLILPLGAAFSFGPPPLPDDEVPAPSSGDRGLYRVTLGGEWAGDEPVREWAFQWGEESESGASALLPDSIRLHTWGEDWTPTMNPISIATQPGPIDLLLTSDGVIVAAQRSEHQARSDHGATTRIPNTSESSTERTEFFSEAMQHCLVLGLHQGRPLDAATVPGAAPCHLPFVPEVLPKGIALQPSHVTTLPGGYPAVEAKGSDEDWTVQSWSAPNIAYPLRLDVAKSDASASFELVGIEAGQSGPLPADTWVEPMVLRPIPPRPLTPLGPEAGGWSSEWELDGLMETARNDPVWTDLGEYLEAHPDAVVIFASGVGGNELRHSRVVGLSDGEDVFGFVARRSTDAPDVVTYRRFSFPEEAPGPQQWPTHAPTFGAAAARLEHAVKGMEWPPASIDMRFDMYCAVLCAGGEALITATTGHESFSGLGVEDDLGLILQEKSSDSVSMDFDQDGDIRHIVTKTYRSANEVNGFERLEALTSDSDSAPPPSDALARHQDLTAPTPWPWVGAGAFVILLAILFSLSKFKAAMWIGFTRLRNEQIVRHPVRGKILRTIESEPGIHLSQIHRRLGMNKNHLQHHLRKLQHAGVIVEKNDNGRMCYFLVGRIDHRIMAAIPLLKSDAARRILEIVQARPGISLSGLSEDAGIAVSTANYHVHRLSRCGLIGAEKVGKTLKLRPLELAEELGAVAQRE